MAAALTLTKDDRCTSAFNTANIAGGTAVGLNTADGATVSFSCEAGFTASGVATCTTGDW